MRKQNMPATSLQRIPLSVPHLAGREAEYLQACVRDNWVSSVGPYVSDFEARFAEFVGTKRAVACGAGTAALHLALAALSVGAGDLVLVSSLTFIASVNPIRYVGADPVLVDCDPVTWQIDAGLVERFLVEECRIENDTCIHEATGRRVAALMPAHILGHGADIGRLAALAKNHRLVLVEDAAEALGVRFGDRHAGTIGAAGCFSFNGNKTITTGGGGMVVTDNDDLADRIRFLSEQAKVAGAEYVHTEIGFNYRMSNIHAAVGLAQLEQLAGHLRRKRKIAERYRESFGGIDGLSWIEPATDVAGAWWLFTLAIDAAVTRLSARDLMRRLADVGIDSRPLWQPIHMSEPYLGALRLGGDNAATLYEQALSLPSSVGLSSDDQSRVISTVIRLFEEARGRNADA